jgi:SNF2 family DNA or RNA helicase
VELTAVEVAQLARQARPLVKSSRGWVEIDRVDLEHAAAALAEREHSTQLTGADILRYSIGLDGPGLRGGVEVRGHSWATDIVDRAGAASTSPVTRPDGFTGELRAYQAEALAWLGFLDAAELGGCLALDMGLGKTPTVLAQLARTTASGTALVVAPAAVVGNWAAEAARFVPELRVVVHHGASRSAAAQLEAEIAEADVVITTYATAVRDVEALAAVSWRTIVLDEAQAIKNPSSETAVQLRRIPARIRLALTGTPIENGLGDLWAILDFTNPGLIGSRPAFIAQLSGDGDTALRALNGILLFRRTKSEPQVAAELPDKIEELDHCTMTAEQIGLYQAVLDDLVSDVADPDSMGERKKGAILAAITALKQICNHPAAYRDDGQPLAGRSGKLARLEQIIDAVFAADERILVFTHFATWGRRLAAHLSDLTDTAIASYDGSLTRGTRDRLVREFQQGQGFGALVLSLKAGGTGLNLTAANHVVLYDRWWNPAVEDQARDRAWRIGQHRTVISHRLVCPGTVDERVEEVVAGKRHIAQLVLPRSSSITDLNTDQLRLALGLRPEELLTDDQ